MHACGPLTAPPDVEAPTPAADTAVGGAGGQAKPRTTRTRRKAVG